MSTYAEIKAGTPCMMWSDYTRGAEYTYPQDDLLKVTFENDTYVRCGALAFAKSNVRVIAPQH